MLFEYLEKPPSYIIYLTLSRVQLAPPCIFTVINRLHVRGDFAGTVSVTASRWFDALIRSFVKCWRSQSPPRLKQKPSLLYVTGGNRCPALQSLADTLWQRRVRILMFDETEIQFCSGVFSTGVRNCTFKLMNRLKKCCSLETSKQSSLFKLQH